jgi:hypothetical protein
MRHPIRLTELAETSPHLFDLHPYFAEVLMDVQNDDSDVQDELLNIPILIADA